MADIPIPHFDAETPVPDDRLLPGLHTVDAPSPSVLATLFARAHEQSEVTYNGNGSWGSGFVYDESSARWRALFARPEDYIDRPTVRDAARRVSGYACALDVAEVPVYRDRLVAGVEWLLSQQFADGSFPWWVSRTGMPGTDHLYYVTGYAVVALLDAYRHCREQRILRAVERAAVWTAAGHASQNNNYNSFACWALARWHGHQPGPGFLEAAIRFTVEGVLPRQLANGGWAGHNSWVYYQGIIVAGLALLLPTIPLMDARRAQIEPCYFKAINNLLARQNAAGALLATFDPQERAEAEVRRVGYENAPASMADPHALLGLLWAHEYAGADDSRATAALTKAYADEMLKDGPESDPGGHGIDTMVLGHAWRWLAGRSGIGAEKETQTH